jgi:hypothetical protein
LPEIENPTLDSPPATFVAPVSTQPTTTVVTVPVTRMATHATTIKVPQPWDTKNCPSFDGKTAESLMKFLRYCKMIIEGSNMTDDDEKKKMVKNFLSYHVNEEWSSLSSYATGTFDEWVAEIEGLFPEIKTMRIGSLERLNQICTSNAGLRKQDDGKIKRFSLQFKNEAEKLMAHPVLVTNPVLVDKYIACFEEGFAREIDMMISQTIYWEKRNGTGPAAAAGPAPGPQPGLAPVARPEDTIPLGRLIDMVEDLCVINVNRTPSVSNLNTNNMTPTFESASVNPDILKIKTEVREHKVLLDACANDIAQIKDGQALAEKRTVAGFMEVNQNLLKNLAEFKQLMSQSTGKEGSYRDKPPHQDAGYGSQQANHNFNNNSGGSYRSNDNKDCFYCYLAGHMVRDCPYKREHIDLGRILISNNQMRLGDGSPFPKYPESKSKKQRVDDYYAGKTVPGAPQVLIQNYDHPSQDMSQFHSQIVDNLCTVYDSRDDEIRTLQVQTFIRTQLSQVQTTQFPVASYHQGAQMLPNGGGTVQTHAPNSQNFQPNLAQQNFVTGIPQGYQPGIAQFQQAQVPSPAQPGGMDLTQLLSLVNAIKGVNDAVGPAAQEQLLAQTRKNAQEASGGSNL